VLGPDFVHCGIASGAMPAFLLFPLNNRSRLTITNLQGTVLNAEARLCSSLTIPSRSTVEPCFGAAAPGMYR
jgi:hypothetical protein